MNSDPTDVHNALRQPNPAWNLADLAGTTSTNGGHAHSITVFERLLASAATFKQARASALGALNKFPSEGSGEVDMSGATEVHAALRASMDVTWAAAALAASMGAAVEILEPESGDGVEFVDVVVMTCLKF